MVHVHELVPLIDRQCLAHNAYLGDLQIQQACMIVIQAIQDIVHGPRAGASQQGGAAVKVPSPRPNSSATG